MSISSLSTRALISTRHMKQTAPVWASIATFDMPAKCAHCQLISRKWPDTQNALQLQVQNFSEHLSTVSIIAAGIIGAVVTKYRGTQLENVIRNEQLLQHLLMKKLVCKTSEQLLTCYYLQRLWWEENHIAAPICNRVLKH